MRWDATKNLEKKKKKKTLYYESDLSKCNVGWGETLYLLKTGEISEISEWNWVKQVSYRQGI